MKPDERDAVLSQESLDFYVKAARKASLACQVTLAGFEADDASLLVAASRLWGEVAGISAIATVSLLRAEEAARYAKDEKPTCPSPPSS